MAGIYIHIPFCKQACHYCNFHFSTSLKLQNDFSSALLKEVALRKDYLGGDRVETIYFGGGTPSLLKEAELSAVMDAIHAHFDVDADAEITLEANPDDINAANLGVWQKTGVNRLSIGVQSFFEDDLAWMHRAHTGVQADTSIRLAQDVGITNMSIDLIYGTPGLTDMKWEENMRKAAGLSVPHLSCYALTVEQGTALDAMIKRKKVRDVSTDDQARQFLMMTDFFQSAGYEHYEISNLALPGRRSAHNSSYWSGAKYIGLGPSAHSYNAISRQWNVSNNALYIHSINNQEVPFEIETLSDTQKFNEYVMTALRKAEGVDLHFVGQRFGGQRMERLVSQGKRFVSKKWIVDAADTLILTREGKLFADHIASELFA